MFVLIEALNFRCLRYIRQPLGPLHVLVGPNASGKTTFLDLFGFLSDFVAEGLAEAIAKRTHNLRDLLWAQAGDRFELAVEAAVPPERVRMLPDPTPGYFRYEVVIGIDPETKENSILYEIGSLKKHAPNKCEGSLELFPRSQIPPKTILEHPKHKREGSRRVFTKKPGQHDNYYPETRSDSGSGGWVPTFRLGPQRSTLANLPEDESRFPVSTWFKEQLTRGVERLVLNSLLIRRASPPGQVRGFKSDGSNLPWVIHGLENGSKERKAAWIAHLRTALPDLEDIETRERAEDRHRYLVLKYREGIKVPSWMASDGTLRLLALTLPAYLPGFTGVYLIEEPENGIHPRAVQTMFDSLSSVYGAQMLLATHSPIILSIVDAQKVLCFAKTPEGATDIVAGHRHPRLKEWRGEENLGVLFAGGVLD